MKTDDILTGIKLALTAVVGIGISALFNTFSGGLTGKMKPVEKICVGFASAVMGGMVAEKAGEYIEEKVDGVMATVNAVSDVMKQAKTEQTTEEESHE